MKVINSKDTKDFSWTWCTECGPEGHPVVFCNWCKTKICKSNAARYLFEQVDKLPIGVCRHCVGLILIEDDPPSYEELCSEE